MTNRGISAAEPPAAFARRHFGALDLGDRRLTRRAVKVVEAAATDPAASIPRQYADPHQAKGAYRFFDHPAVTSASVSQQHRDLTLRSAREEGTVLFVQDTTHLPFGPPGSREGLGPVSTSQTSDGLMTHSTLALTPGPSGVVLGLGHLKIWARGPVRRGESKEKRRVRETRESLRWMEAIEAVGSPPEGSRWVHVGDREADVWETFQAAIKVGSDCAIRACGAAGQRKAVVGHREQLPVREEAETLSTLVRALPARGSCEAVRHARPGSPRRELHLSVSFSAVTMLPPRLLKKGSDGLQVWVVRAWEEDAGKETPTEWVLVTTVPVLDVADALRVVDWYRHRWTIEEYHKCLKTGCRVEERQLQEGQRLKPLATVLAIVALRLLNLKKIAKLTPTAPATDAVPREYVWALSKLRNIPESELTCERFWRETAKLGGFLGRKSDGDPGWKTLWLGWGDLQMIVRGARIGLPPTCG